MYIKKHISAINTSLLIAFVISLLPIVAMAQGAPTPTPSPSDWEPTSTDMTSYILKSIFGDWSSATTDVPMLGGAMRVLNLFALTFGTLMFTYVAVVGTLNSAQDGELLGKKWSSMWVPLRFTIGTALLVPLASGYSTIQHLILWLALVGGGAASAVWSAALADFTNPMKSAQSVLNSEDYLNKTRTLTRHILQAEVCSQMLAKSESPQQFGMTPQGIKQPFLIGDGKSVGGYEIDWGAKTDGADKPINACGIIRTSVMHETIIDNGSTKVMSYKSGSAGYSLDTGATSMMPSYKDLSVAQYIGVLEAQAKLAPIAARLVTDQSSVTDIDIATAIDSAAASYRVKTDAAILGVAGAGSTKLSQFIDSASTTGWLMASSTFFQMGRIRSTVTQAANLAPSFEKKPALNGLQGITEGPLFEDLSSIDERVNTAFQGDGTDNPAWYVKIGQTLSLAIGRSFSVNADNTDHALIQIKDKGDYLMTAIEVAATGSTAAVVAASAAAGFGKSVLTEVVTLGGSAALADGAMAAISLLTPAAYMGFIVLFGVAITMSFLLPMLPFMMTIGSILGWLMAVFSAVVAAPVWIAGHLHPEGDGFAGKGISGYMILLETITRPIFIIFGLIGAFVIMDPMLKFVAWSFRANLSSIQGNSVTGFISVIVFAMIYVAIVFTTVRTSLSLISSLAEKVYIWIGGTHAGYDQAGKFTSAAGESTGSAVRGLQGVGGAFAGAAMTRKNMKMKEKEQAAKDAAAAERQSSQGRT